jgi:hypothetical protein
MPTPVGAGDRGPRTPGEDAGALALENVDELEHGRGPRARRRWQ